MSNDKSNARMITFAPAIDSEVGRFILARYGVTYREEPHTLPFLFFIERRLGAIPVFLSNDLKLTPPRNLVEHFETKCPADRKLMPPGLLQEEEIGKAWTNFNVEFGWATAKWAYFHLISNSKVMADLLTRGAPWYEKAVNWFMQPLVVRGMKRRIPLNDETARDALKLIRETFDEVDDKLADGRRFLAGDKFSIVDLLYAVSAAPVVMDERYGGALPKLENVPAEMRSIVDEMRERKAGQFAMRLYEEERYPSFSDS